MVVSNYSGVKRHAFATAISARGNWGHRSQQVGGVLSTTTRHLEYACTVSSALLDEFASQPFRPGVQSSHLDMSLRNGELRGTVDYVQFRSMLQVAMLAALILPQRR